MLHCLVKWLFILSVLAGPVYAQEPFRYPEAKHGQGELKYVNGVPVLRVQGSPEETGEQYGVLALKATAHLPKRAGDFIKQKGWEALYPVLLKSGGILLPRIPADHLKELEAAAKASGWPRDLLVFANTLPDLRRLGGCSTLYVGPERSSADGALFGRNLDWPPFGDIHDYTLVVVFRPNGKRAFASITYPGMLGCFTGINDAGLALADLTVTSAKDDAPKLNLGGVPYTFAFRRVLEECGSVDEAEKLLRSLKRTTMQNIAAADRKAGVVFEITPKTVAVRRADKGLCACTNHFRTEELATETECRRYDILEKSGKKTNSASPMSPSGWTRSIRGARRCKPWSWSCRR
ncbi:MAG: C45 family peptidase [Gemmataceae bacterium]|nr:C45 family peptidase [Gemmataceae bacterium]